MGVGPSGGYPLLRVFLCGVLLSLPRFNATASAQTPLDGPPAVESRAREGECSESCVWESGVGQYGKEGFLGECDRVNPAAGVNASSGECTIVQVGGKCVRGFPGFARGRCCLSKKAKVKSQKIKVGMGSA
jgi:hypothetical protein